MATVPSAYYQSPWIADAARNLASALAPPDPEKQLANKRAQWLFEQQQEMAHLAEADRADKQTAESKFAAMLNVNPAVNPITGVIDEEETARQVRALLAEGIDAGGDAGVGLKLAGTASPVFAQQEALKYIAAADAQARLSQRIGGQMDLARFVQGQMGDRQDSAYSNALGLEDRRQSGRMQLQLARQQARLAELKAKGAGGSVPMIAGKNLEDLVYLTDTMIAQSGKHMRPEDYDKFIDNAAIYAQQTKSIPTAVNMAWADAFPGAANYGDAPSTDVPEPATWANRFIRMMGGNPTDPYLAPRFGVPTAEPSYGAAVTSPRAAPPPRATAPTTPAAAPGSPPANRLKEGVITTFGNGQKWTLKDGVPTRVK